jgi:hypothetical protein
MMGKIGQEHRLGIVTPGGETPHYLGKRGRPRAFVNAAKE